MENKEMESKNLRKPNEVILKSGKTLQEVLELHKMWLDNEEGGERANLSGEDLSYVNLRSANMRDANINHGNLYGADLSHAILEGADLSHAILEGAILEGVDLEGVDLNHANLSYADLSGTNLSYANFYGTNLSYANLTNTNFYLTNLYKAKGDFVGVENIGSRSDTTHYFYNIDKVICGCFSGTMEEFEEKVKESYSEGDIEYQEYMMAIEFLKGLSELEMK